MCVTQRVQLCFENSFLESFGDLRQFCEILLNLDEILVHIDLKILEKVLSRL